MDGPRGTPNTRGKSRIVSIFSLIFSAILLFHLDTIEIKADLVQRIPAPLEFTVFLLVDKQCESGDFFEVDRNQKTISVIYYLEHCRDAQDRLEQKIVRFDYFVLQAVPGIWSITAQIENTGMNDSTIVLYVVRTYNLFVPLITR